MNRKYISHRAIIFSFLALAALAIAAEAQQQLSSLMSGMAANARQLKQYTFKQRTEIYYKGDLKTAKLDEVHYNSNGERVVIPLHEEKAESKARPRLPGFGLVARKIENKQEETKQYVERLMFLTSRYLNSDPAKLQAAIGKADVNKSFGNSLVRIQMYDYVKAGDMMTMTLDSATNRPIKTEVETTLDGGPVSIVLTFDQIRGDGPSYPGKATVRSDAEELEVRILTYDYRL